VAKAFDNMPVSQAKFNLLQPFCEYLGNGERYKEVKEGVDMVIEFRDALAAYGLTPYVNGLLKGVVAKKESAKAMTAEKGGAQEQIDYINGKIVFREEKLLAF
jgi:aminopeptidase N